MRNKLSDIKHDDRSIKRRKEFTAFKIVEQMITATGSIAIISRNTYHIDLVTQCLMLFALRTHYMQSNASNCMRYHRADDGYAAKVVPGTVYIKRNWRGEFRKIGSSFDNLWLLLCSVLDGKWLCVYELDASSNI